MATYKHKDRLFQKAKAEGYRSRAAYKLLELQDQFNLMRPKDRVLDLGCSPGGWLQVVAQIVGSEGVVIGVDLEQIQPFSAVELQSGDGLQAANPVFIKGDFLNAEIQQKIVQISQQKFNAVLSDMSPKLSGVKLKDMARAAELYRAARSAALNFLSAKGVLVIKVFPGEETEEFVKESKQWFSRIRRKALKSSRASSNEQYVLMWGPMNKKAMDDGNS